MATYIEGEETLEDLVDGGVPWTPGFHGVLRALFPNRVHSTPGDNPAVPAGNEGAPPDSVPSTSPHFMSEMEDALTTRPCSLVDYLAENRIPAHRRSEFEDPNPHLEDPPSSSLAMSTASAARDRTVDMNEQIGDRTPDTELLRVACLRTVDHLPPGTEEPDWALVLEYIEFHRDAGREIERCVHLPVHSRLVESLSPTLRLCCARLGEDGPGSFVPLPVAELAVGLALWEYFYHGNPSALVCRLLKGESAEIPSPVPALREQLAVLATSQVKSALTCAKSMRKILAQHVLFNEGLVQMVNELCDRLIMLSFDRENPGLLEGAGLACH